jgi:hypothetical protein
VVEPAAVPAPVHVPQLRGGGAVDPDVRSYTCAFCDSNYSSSCRRRPRRRAARFGSASA